MSLPVFRYHPDPVRSGSIVESRKTCRCCGQCRGFVYSGPVYAEEELEDNLCPWCIADGSAHRRFEATFVDTEAFPDGTPDTAVGEISQRTPGFCAWQTEHWPACCGDGTALLMPAGIAEIRDHHHELEGDIMGYIVHELHISGGAATRLLNSLNRDTSPTLYLFRCLSCGRHHFHIDYL